MPRLNATVQVDGVPLQRAYIEHLVLGVGQPSMYMTDDMGRVRDEHGDLGIDSFTGNADIRVLCQNSVVKVLDGNTPGPFAVNQDTSITDGATVNIHTAARQHDHYDILNRCLLTYDVVFRQFRPFSDGAHTDFPLGRAATLRATKDQQRRIELSFPSNIPVPSLSFTEPASAATGFPLLQIRSRASDGRLRGDGGMHPTLIPSEFAHGLHFSLFSQAVRNSLETDYLGFITTDIANGGDGTHSMGKRTTPMVAYVEALDNFSDRFSEFVRQVIQGGTVNRLRPVQPTVQMRQAFFARELDGTQVEGVSVGRLNAQGRIVPSFQGTDDEGAVYGCIFVDFARRKGLRTAVNAYLRSASAAVRTFGEYKSWIAQHEPENLADLTAAQQTWGL